MIFLVALILRVAYVLSLEEKWYFFDTVYYDAAAQSLIQGEGFGPSLYFQNLYANYCLEPLYPLFLASAYGIFGHSFLVPRIYQVILSMLVLLLLYILSKKLCPSHCSLVLLLYGAVFPFFVFITGLLYITQLFTFFIVLQIFVFYRFYITQRLGWLIVGGLLMGLAILARPIYLLSIPLFYLWVFFACKGRFGKKTLTVFVSVILTMLALTPWTVRNALVFQKFAFARACLSQSEAFGSTFWEIQRRKVYGEHGFRARQLGVHCYFENNRVAVDYYVDGKPEYKYVSLEDINLPDFDSYSGILFCGPFENRLKSIRGYERSISGADTTDHIVFNSDSPEIDFVHVHNVQKTDSFFVFSADGDGWEFPMVFTQGGRSNYFEMDYAPGTMAQQARRVAMLIYLDKPQLKSTGLMVWLHPWGEPDLWRFENGKPASSIQVLKYPYESKRYSFKNLLSKYPKEYLLVHYIPRFLRFWSPKVTGVRNKEQQPGPLKQALSISFFIPVLILFPFGIWKMRRNFITLALLLIPIVTLSFGYSIFGTQTRYRIPIDGFLILLAAQGLSLLRGVKKEC